MTPHPPPPVTVSAFTVIILTVKGHQGLGWGGGVSINAGTYSEALLLAFIMQGIENEAK